MSFTTSRLAARCELQELLEAMLAAWPTLEVAEPVRTFPSWDEARRWADPCCDYMAGNHPHDVKLFHGDGGWSVISDISTCMAADRESLADLSRRVGRLDVATTQGTAGFAQLHAFEAGVAIRSITGQDHRTTQASAPIAQEAGIPLEPFHVDELDTIWQRLGPSSFLKADPVGPVAAVHVLDRTPLAESAQGATDTRPPRRPRWKLW